MSSPRIIVSRGMAAFAFLLAITLAARTASAQTETVLYGFCLQVSTCPDGNYPSAALITDGKGTFYGTTSFGGTYNSGTVFKVSPTGIETTLYSFGANSTDGNTPVSSLLMDKSGNLYGTTLRGGTNSVGTVFKLNPDDMETILHSFNVSDGGAPAAGLIADADGNFYGTTSYYGPYNDGGTLFKLAPDGTETILHNFGSGADASQPSGTLLMDKSGNLYGTSQRGGTYNDGAVFKLSPDGTETVLHSFRFSPTNGDGVGPMAGVIMDRKGNLYGTTEYGGDFSHGTLFKLSPDGTETILHRFGYKSDGQEPICALVRDAKGNLYGTTFLGGAKYSGTVFEYRTDGTVITLHAFSQSGTDGYYPTAGVIMDSNGNLYGTTTHGAGFVGGGTVFEITP